MKLEDLELAVKALSKRLDEHIDTLPETQPSQESLDREDRHHRLAAHARDLLDNSGFGPNEAQREEIDEILREIAGLPVKETVRKPRTRLEALVNEIDCRIAYGANSNGHLQYVQKQLRGILTQASL